jgi:hypothetical protein
VKYGLNLVGMQYVGWDLGGTELQHSYIFLYGSGSADRHLGTFFFLLKAVIF